MKNILMISYDLPPMSVWGVAKHVNGLANLLQDHFNVILVSRSKNLENEFVSITSDKLSDCLIESKLLPNESYIDFEYLMSWNYLLAKKVIAEIKSVPHVVHNHNWMTFPAAKTIADHFNSKIVSTIHFLQKQYFLASKISPIDSDEIIELEDKIFKTSDSIILFGENHRQFVMNNYNYIPDKTIIIPHGISTPKSIKQKTFRFKNASKVKILFVGRLIKDKGILDLIAAIKILREKYNNIELHIAGTGILHNHLCFNEEYIKYHGFLDELKLNALYSNSDIFCFPSYTETFGLVTIEAAAYGLPLIVSKGKYVEKLFTNNEALFVNVTYDKNTCSLDRNQLINNIEELITNNRLYNKHSENARKAAFRYNENNMIKKLKKLYDVLIKQTR